MCFITKTTKKKSLRSGRFWVVFWRCGSGQALAIHLCPSFLFIHCTAYLNIVSEKKDNKSKIYQADRVESKYLKRKYKIASDTIKKYLEEQNEQEKYFEDKPEKIKNILLLMIALILVLITSLPFIEINTLSLLPLSVILSQIHIMEEKISLRESCR